MAMDRRVDADQYLACHLRLKSHLFRYATTQVSDIRTLCGRTFADWQRRSKHPPSTRETCPFESVLTSTPPAPPGAVILTVRDVHDLPMAAQLCVQSAFEASRHQARKVHSQAQIVRLAFEFAVLCIQMESQRDGVGMYRVY